MLFNIVKDMAHKILLTKLVLIDSDLKPYLAALLVVVLYKVYDMICIPKKGNMIKLIEKEFENFLGNEETKIYNYYSTLLWYYCLHALSKKSVN